MYGVYSATTELRADLSKLVSAFSFSYACYVQESGALCQLWLPDSSGCLTTQGSPYSIMGVSDYLALYKFVSGRYRPSCDGHNKACPISRVFVGLQPQLAPDPSSKSPLEFDRQAEAQRCHIHSNLLLPVYDMRLPVDSDPVGVFELAQHEVNVDFAVAVNSLKEAAQACGFCIPSLGAAHSVDACEVPLEPLPPSGSGSSRCVTSSKQRSSTPEPQGPPPSCSRPPSAAIRRSSCLVAGPLPAAEPEGVEDLDQECNSSQQQQQQQGQSGLGYRSCRPSVIVTDHYTFDAADRAGSMHRVGDKGANLEATAGSNAAVAAAPRLRRSSSSSCFAAYAYAATVQAAAEACSDVPCTDSIAQHQPQPSYVLDYGGSIRESPALLRSHNQVPKGVHFSPLPQPQTLNDQALEQQQQQHSMPLLAGQASSKPPMRRSPSWCQAAQQHSLELELELEMLKLQLESSGSFSNREQQQQSQEQFGERLEKQGSGRRPPCRALSMSAAEAQARTAAAAAFGRLEQESGRRPPQRCFSMRAAAAAAPHSVASLGGFPSSDMNCFSNGEFALSRLSSGTGRSDRVRVLVAHSGSFRHTGLAGMFEYVGGAQKLMVLDRTHGVAELQEQLGSRGAPMGVTLGQCKMKYALPGGCSGPATFIELETDEDVDLMWDEFEDFVACSGKSSAKLQLYVESCSTSRTSSGRSSGGSGSSCLPSPFTRAASMQPDTPPVSSGTPSTALALMDSSSIAAVAAAFHDPACSMMPTVPLTGIAAGVAPAIVTEAEPASNRHPDTAADSHSIPECLSSVAPVLTLAPSFKEGAAAAEVVVPRHVASAAAFLPDIAAGSSKGGMVSDAPVHQQRDQMRQLITVLQCKMEILTPDQINIMRFLGGGAFGEVYLGRWHGTEVAVKCLSPSLITSGQDGIPCMHAVSELLKEAGMLASLRHPNIVSVFGVVLPPTELMHDSNTFMSRSALAQGHPPAPAVVTEYMAAGSLRQALSNGAPWLQNNMAKVKMLLDTARGLDYLHSKRLVHFDLKSANLLVTMKDKVPCVKIADMGLTKARNKTFVTGVDSVRGTLPWIAPEIVKHPQWGVTEAADIYSFGVIMWEVWTGQEPFDNMPMHALLHQLASPEGLSLPVPGSPEWGQEPVPGEPAPGWSSLMQQCWSAPQQRPTARQLVPALDSMMDTLRSMRRTEGN